MTVYTENDQNNYDSAIINEKTGETIKLESRGYMEKGALKYYLWALTSGAATLSAWNIILNCIPNFMALWGEHTQIWMITGSNQAGSFVSSLFFTLLGNQSTNLHFWNINTGVTLLVLMVLGSVGYMLEPNKKSASIILPLIGFVAGISKGTYQSMSFAFSTIVKTSYSQSGFISIGNAVVGLLSFVVYLILFYVIGTDDLLRQSLVICLQTSAMTILVLISNIILGIFVQKDPVFRAQHEEAVSSYFNDTNDKNSSTLSESKYELSIKILYPTIRPGIVLLTTLLLFPNVLPYGFRNISILVKTINVGLFQVGDIIMRGLPIIVPQLQLSYYLTEIVIYARLVVALPLAIFVSRTDNETQSSIVMVSSLMVFWIVTHGLAMSMSIIQCLEIDVSVREKQWRANFMCLLIVAGAAVGSYASALL